MTPYRISASRRIGAPADVSYGIIADYRSGHPHIIPPQYFRNLRVERGGVGAGTVIRFELHAFGKVNPTLAEVTEPLPGRVLVETYPEAGIHTTFTVAPVEGDHASDVTIITEMKSRGGLLGIIERTMTRSFFRKVFVKELALLDAVARQRSASRVLAKRGSS
jgi:hypothetical protein